MYRDHSVYHSMCPVGERSYIVKSRLSLAGCIHKMIPACYMFSLRPLRPCSATDGKYVWILTEYATYNDTCYMVTHFFFFLCVCVCVGGGMCCICHWSALLLKWYKHIIDTGDTGSKHTAIVKKLIINCDVLDTYCGNITRPEKHSALYCNRALYLGCINFALQWCRVSIMMSQMLGNSTVCLTDCSVRPTTRKPWKLSISGSLLGMQWWH